MKKYDIILCECQCSEHQILFQYDDDPDWENLYISYHLQNYGFWNRLIKGIRYIFGFKSRYGNFGELVLEADDTTIEKFEHIVDALKNIQKNQIIKKDEIH